MASFDIVIQVTYVYRPSAGEKVLGTKQILLASGHHFESHCGKQRNNMSDNRIIGSFRTSLSYLFGSLWYSTDEEQRNRTSVDKTKE